MRLFLHRRFLTPRAAAYVVLSFGLLAGALMLQPRFTVPDLAQDYAAAWGWWHGQSSNAPTDQLLRACCTNLISPAKYPNMQTAHPPFATLLTVPLIPFGWAAARIVWCGIMWACVVGGWWAGRVTLASAAATASFWLIALVLGTHEPLLFAMLMIALQTIDRAPLRAGVLVGLCIALKAYPALILIGLWMSGRRRAAIASVITAAVVMLVAEAIIGWGATLAWLRYMPVNTARYVDTLENGSLVKLVREVVPGAAPVVAAAVLTALLALPLRRYMRATDGIRPLVALMLLVSPLSWRHYMGLVSLEPLGRIEQALLGVAGVVVLLIGLGVLPGDYLAPVTQLPLLITLLALWYRHVRAALRSPRPRRAIPQPSSVRYN